MRFLVDECTGPGVAAWLGANGHDVFSAYDQAAGETDSNLLSRAVNEDRIVVTNDRDFGEMIHREGRIHRGVVFMRLHDERNANKIRVMEQVLATHADQLAGQFVVVTESHIRFAGGSPS
jgi:predicted nuclease of predicted toxin-antitoxin system